jgi:hypothetical protein
LAGLTIRRSTSFGVVRVEAFPIILSKALMPTRGTKQADEIGPSIKDSTTLRASRPGRSKQSANRLEVVERLIARINGRSCIILHSMFRNPWRYVACLLVVHSLLLAHLAVIHSPTLNEPAHLVAGLSHWLSGDFSLYPVNPPLVRMVAALPTHLIGYEADWSSYSRSPGFQPVFRMGEDFVHANQQRTLLFTTLGRIACLPFSLLGAVVCFCWARDLWGAPSGLAACLMWCSSPMILGHGSLLTPDVHASALGVAACYTFWRWLKKPTWAQAAITGIVLGCAELAKTTLILFFPVWPVIWIGYRLVDRRALRPTDWFREASMLMLRMAIGLYVLNLGYGFSGTGKRLGQYYFVSELLTYANQESATAAPSVQSSIAATRSFSGRSNRFSGTFLGSIPFPFPEDYVKGIDIQRRDFESFPRPSYLRGEWRERGWWYYYLYALAVKAPVGTLLLCATATLVSLCRSCFAGRSGSESPLHGGSTAEHEGTDGRDCLVLMVPPLLIFAMVSSQTAFSHHLRYVLPCFPFAFIWASSVFSICNATLHPQLVDSRRDAEIIPQAGRMWRIFVCYCVLCLGWSSLSSAAEYPHCISHFNEFARRSDGGGAAHLLNSNIDWGQDLLGLDRWVHANADELRHKPLYLAYYGYFNPCDIGVSYTVPWPTVVAADPKSVSWLATDREPVVLDPGYYAISVNLLRGFPEAPRGGCQMIHEGRGELRSTYDRMSRVHPAVLEFFRLRSPAATIGRSILIYVVEKKVEVQSRI